MGPFLKGAGAIAFVIDYLARGSPASFLLFAASDGALALLTLWALLVCPAVVSSANREELRPSSPPVPRTQGPAR